MIGCGTVTGPIDGDLAMLIGVLGETPSGPAVGFTALPRRPVTTTLQSLIHQDVPLCGMAVRHGRAAWWISNFAVIRCSTANAVLAVAIKHCMMFESRTEVFQVCIIVCGV